MSIFAHPFFFMTVPYFYFPGKPDDGAIQLGEDASKHIAQVLRMQIGDRLRITDGMGSLYDAVLSVVHKKHTVAAVQHQHSVPPRAQPSAIAISLLKNTTRFEWFIEKATELGIGNIFPLICDRTEKEKFRFDRVHSIMVSAMLQSQQAWLPRLEEPRPLPKLLEGSFPNRYIAHCEARNGKLLLNEANLEGGAIVLIGPEGDFSTTEIDLAIAKGFLQVSLGDTRLRTETAAILAAAMLTHCG